jgi:thiamine biosynthesis lipoprotein
MKDLIDSKLGDINQAMSTYIKDSELSLFNQSAIGSEQKVSSELYDVIALAQRISADSKGAYDISVGPLINLWGFGPYKKVIKAPSEQRIKEVRQRVGFQHLELLGHGRMKKHVDLSLDLSSIAKGYAVDQIANILSEQGLTAFLVEIGGELVTRGLKADNKPWKIAVESPTSKRQIQRIVRVDDIAVATSGDYRNYFEEKGVRYSHIIDTITGKPITHRLASVTVLADNCALADALATAFLAMGTEKAFQYAIDNGIDALFISKAGNGFEEKVTAGFAKRILQ